MTLHDLREAPKARARFAALDPDNGMVVETGDQLYHGDEAMHMLSMLSTRSGVLNRISAAILRHRLLARGLYPILRAGRNAPKVARPGSAGGTMGKLATHTHPKGTTPTRTPCAGLQAPSVGLKAP